MGFHTVSFSHRSSIHPLMVLSCREAVHNLLPWVPSPSPAPFFLACCRAEKHLVEYTKTSPPPSPFLHPVTQDVISNPHWSTQACFLECVVLLTCYRVVRANKHGQSLSICGGNVTNLQDDSIYVLYAQRLQFRLKPN